MRNIFFLIDSTLYAYKSFYIINYKKKKINFKKSFLVFWNMIFSKYKIYKPNYIFFIFDYDRSNFRKKIYKKYKSNRKKISKELLIYILGIKKFFDILNIKYFSYPDVEGDDVIGSLVKKISNIFKKKKHLIYILSYDKDFLQLVNNNVYLFISIDNILNPKYTFRKYGIYPNFFKDLLILCGDKSDNIPGIKGIGIKKAIILINNIGNIKNIYNNLHKIKYLKISNSNTIINNLKKNINNIKLWSTLISIKLNLKINLNINNFKINKFFFYNIFNFLKKFNFTDKIF